LLTRETTVLKEACLLRAFAVVSSHCVPELFAPGNTCALAPVNCKPLKQRRQQHFIDPALSQFRADLNRTVTTIDAVMDIGFSESVIVLQALIGQSAEHGVDRGIAKSLRRKFAFELAARVLAAR